MQTIITYASSLKIDEKTGEWINDYRLRRIVDEPIPEPRTSILDALGASSSPGEKILSIREHAYYATRKRWILRKRGKDRKVRQWFEDTDTLDRRFPSPLKGGAEA